MIDPRTYVTRGLFCGPREIAAQGLFSCDVIIAGTNTDIVIKAKTSISGGGGGRKQQPIYLELPPEKLKDLIRREDEEILTIIKAYLKL